MPIYEFYCQSCHTIFSFMSPRIDTEARPPCPQCGQPELERKPSSFATLKRKGQDEEGAEDDPFAHLDESRLEGAMDSLAREMEGVGDDADPRAMGRLMRRFGELTGLEMGDRMQEMVRRLEAGEDPEALEAEMDLGEGEDGDDSLEDFFKVKQVVARRQRKPKVDETIYWL